MKLFREQITNLIGQCVSRGTSTLLCLVEHITEFFINIITKIGRCIRCVFCFMNKEQRSDRQDEGYTVSNINNVQQSVRTERADEDNT